MKAILYASLALLLSACGGAATKSDNALSSNDFESLDGWTGSPDGTPSLTKEQAHSGAYSVKVDPAIEYSAGYANPLGRLSPSRVGKLKVHAWVYLPSDKDNPQLVVQLTNPNETKPALWEGLDLRNEAKAKGFGKWIEVERTLPLPESATANSQLRVYMWRVDSPEASYLDDLQIDRAE